MARSVAIVGAGVAGLTCGVLFAERNRRTVIFAREIGTASTAAVAVWCPYDTGPVEKTIPWALETYAVLHELARDPGTGVSMIELRKFSRAGDMEIPEWVRSLGGGRVRSDIPAAFVSGFAVPVPLMDTTIYLDYLVQRFGAASGRLELNRRLGSLEEVDPRFDLVIHCAGIGARTLANDSDLEPHRGQVALVEKLDLSGAIVSDDPPLMYAIPRRRDCVFGGTNETSANEAVDPAVTASLVAECSRVLEIAAPTVIGERVGLRPFRRSGVRVESGRLRDGRQVIHNYGHGGSGFTLSWGCAREVAGMGVEVDR